MYDILQKLIAFPTVTGDSDANKLALDYIDDFLRCRGMVVQRHSYNGHESLVATTKATKTPEVLLAAHLDIVPASTDDQYILREEKGKLFGRGVFDMKFAIAAYLQLVDDLKGELAHYDFGIMITTDEENGGFNGTKWLLTQGYRPRVAVIPDGGDNWAIETFAKGIWWAKLTATGKSAHGSRPWEGESALEKLLAFLALIRQELFATQTPESTTMIIGSIEAGQAVNQIPDNAVAQLDIRTASREEHMFVKDTLQGLCDKHGIAIATTSEGSPCVNDPKNPYIKQFTDCIESVTGYPSGSTISFGATDGRYFSDLDIPCVIVRPAGGGHHGPDEWLSKEGLDQLLVVLRRYVDTVAR